MKHLGSGGFAKVMLVRRRTPGTQEAMGAIRELSPLLAMKVMKKEHIVRHRQERDEAACRLCGQNYGEFNTCACTWGTSMTSQRNEVENEDANALRIVSHLSSPWNEP